MSYSTLTDISQTIDWIKSTLSEENEWNWAFVLKSENKVIGTGSIGPDAHMKGYWGIGYNLHYDFAAHICFVEAKLIAVKVVRENTDIPCAIGFGISTPEQAKKMADISDGAIVGSAIIKLIAKHGKSAPKYIADYVKSMKDAIR